MNRYKINTILKEKRKSLALRFKNISARNERNKSSGTLGDNQNWNKNTAGNAVKRFIVSRAFLLELRRKW